MKKIGGKAGLFLAAIAIMSCCFCPQRAAAQDKAALSIMILNTGYNLEVNAGKDNHFSLEVRNVGTTTMNNIRLSSDEIGDWEIEFTPEEIQSLSPGSVQVVDVNIKPSSNVSGKAHYIRIFATSGVFQTLQSYQVEIHTGPVWLWVVIAVAITVIVIFIAVFLRMGRHR